MTKNKTDSVIAWYNDEHALTLGVRQVVVKTKTGTTTTNYPVTTLSSVPGGASDPAVGTTGTSGDQAGLDPSDRPTFPALFVTDITANPNSKAGDWPAVRRGPAAEPSGLTNEGYGAEVRLDIGPRPPERPCLPAAVHGPRRRPEQGRRRLRRELRERRLGRLRRRVAARTRPRSGAVVSRSGLSS